MNDAEFESQLTSALELTRRPVAASSHEQPPLSGARFKGTVSSGCSFWRLAAEGRTFFSRCRHSGGVPAGLMLLVENAARGGVPSAMPLLAQPTCIAIPAALASGVITSTGCVGNRADADIRGS